MGASSSATAESPLNEAKRNKWEEYFAKIGRGKGGVNDASSKDGWTALHSAARQGSATVIAQLIEMGADIDKKTVTGKTPLAIAVRYNKKVDAVSCLLRNGAAPEATDDEGDTPLHKAAQQGFIDAIVVLVEVGADLDAANRFGWTPLHKAALLRGRMPQAAIRLVELGADIGIRTQNGTLASDIARTSGCADLAAWLEEELARGRPKRCPRRQPSLAPVSEVPARLAPETPGVIWSAPHKLDVDPVLKEAYRVAVQSPSAKPGKKRWNKAPSMDDIPDHTPRDTLTEQLGPILHELGLRDKIPAAVQWCLQQGAENLDDIVQDKGCSEDLAAALGLPRIKQAVNTRTVQEGGLRSSAPRSPRMLALLSAPPLGLMVTAVRAPARHGARMLAGAGEDDGIDAYAAAITAAAARQVPFTAGEVGSAVKSAFNLVGDRPWCEEYGHWVAECAHLPHKEWGRTQASAAALSRLVGPSTDDFRSLFEVVLADGGWDAAAAAAAGRGTDDRPWAVLVTGVNGIRKTTSVYQPWFRDALAAALGAQYGGAVASLPAGGDSYFRQLDYMMATVANEEFRALYEMDDLAGYSRLKGALFARYRTAAECVGAMLVGEAVRSRLNVMVETSGRDAAMFAYVDHFFPDAEYRKLLVHFTVDHVQHAEASVDARMGREMTAGKAALRSAAPAVTLVRANMGGPYGSAGGVLRGVQAESQAVWDRVASAEPGAPAAGWLKARITVEARAGADGWAAVAGGERFEFVPPGQAA